MVLSHFFFVSKVKFRLTRPPLEPPKSNLNNSSHTHNNINNIRKLKYIIYHLNLPNNWVGVFSVRQHKESMPYHCHCLCLKHIVNDCKTHLRHPSASSWTLLMIQTEYHHHHHDAQRSERIRHHRHRRVWNLHQTGCSMYWQELDYLVCLEIKKIYVSIWGKSKQHLEVSNISYNNERSGILIFCYESLESVK